MAEEGNVEALVEPLEALVRVDELERVFYSIVFGDKIVGGGAAIVT